MFVSFFSPVDVEPLELPPQWSATDDAAGQSDQRPQGYGRHYSGGEHGSRAVPATSTASSSATNSTGSTTTAKK